MEQSDTSSILNITNQVEKVGEGETPLAKTQLFLMALATTALLAKQKEIPDEFYQSTQAFLQNTKNEDGSYLPNLSGVIKMIEKDQNIGSTTHAERTNENSTNADFLGINAFNSTRISEANQIARAE